MLHPTDTILFQSIIIQRQITNNYNPFHTERTSVFNNGFLRHCLRHSSRHRKDKFFWMMCALVMADVSLPWRVFLRYFLYSDYNCVVVHAWYVYKAVSLSKIILLIDGKTFRTVVQKFQLPLMFLGLFNCLLENI